MPFRYTFLFLALTITSETVNAQQARFSLADFYNYDAELAYLTDSVFITLTDRQRVAQMIITSAGELGKSNATVKDLVQKNAIGGVVYLKGTKEAHKTLISELNGISIANNTIPLINSMDAEPSLFNGRVKGTTKMMKTININSLEVCDSVVTLIDQTLSEIGVHHNFAPVCDLSPNNEAIKNRSFGSNKDTVILFSTQFIKSSQRDNIVATAKHFPGHGLVKGDTHKQSVYIDGELQEVDIYKPLIEAGVISIMVAHITVLNNEKYQTSELPATCSRTIVTDLLKKEMQFKGIIITDALNIMKAVTILDKAPLKASMAGCDMILMPINEYDTIENILAEMENNPAYKKQVYQSVNKILRLKLCLNLI
ncbi:MAG: beta-N-acetylhexosaminidase [Limisphaerales bacterium]|jgi:beta-N-acetylhexosaminidase